MQNIGAVITTLGIAVLIVALVWAHLTSSNVDPVRDPVTKYAITETRRLYLTAGLAAAIAGVGAIIVLVNVAGGAALPACVFVGAFALLCAIIPFVPVDAPDSPKTTIGRAPGILALLAFASITIAAFLAGGVLGTAGLTTEAVWSTILAIVMAVGIAAVLLSPVVLAFARIVGLWDRLIFVGAIAWLITIVFAALA